MSKFTADFETTTDPKDCRVWAYALCEIGNTNNFIYGNSMDDFIHWVKHNPSTLYFHNLKFDCEFLIHWLFNHGFTWVQNRKNLDVNKFTTLISDKGQFYSCEICTGKKGKRLITTKVFDSLKILPMSVEDVAKGFKLSISKLKIDYDEYRESGHILTQKEISYIHNDVQIIAEALETLFKQDLKQMTQGSNALYDFKKIFTKKRFERDFPPPQYDADIRQSYKGGFTYLNPKYADKDLGEGIVLDVNSLYPSVLYYELLPFGEGKFFKGKYKNDKIYPLYIQMIKCKFELKPDHIPTIQIKHGYSFNPTEYLTSSNGEQVTLCLTNVDLGLMLDHYDVTDIEYMSGWKFRAATGLFKDYIDKWMTIKIESTRSKNAPMRALAKLMLNALYGKFGTNPNVGGKMPILTEEGIIKYKALPMETRTPVYVPIASFTTAYARRKTIITAQKLYDRFIYSDTDSLHLIGNELPTEIEIDEVKLGAWAHEKSFYRARFIRSKCYIEEVDKEWVTAKGKEIRRDLEVTCAGLPKKCYTSEEDEYGNTHTINVTWENFHPKAVYGNKLSYRHVPGGIVLEPIDFTIKG